MHALLHKIVDTIEPERTREAVRGVFEDLNRLLGYAEQLRPALDSGGDAAHALLLLEALRAEALAASASLASECEAGRLPADLSEELGRTGFAVRHELRAVFGRLLVGVETLEDPSEARARFYEAHDLLRNCFQQSTVSLAQMFSPSFDGADVFEDLRLKRENSRRLYEDLDALLRSARNAERRSDRVSLTLFSARLEHFRCDSMRHLMQKDTEACLSFVEDFRVLPNQGEPPRFFLHRFSCYLEILVKHVGMRSVLSKEPHAIAA
ncbi:MAG TPA: hypothetical protein VM936_12145, partial [Pyrinomonadaceae bacterium]|nr:hypothetical protein [Pyrinomonadaceae bacterium]